MSLEILQASVVVVADCHNPSILHPSFLETKGIVEENWELAEAPICTPPLSVVKYSNGIHFVAEVEKFQVIDTQTRKSEPTSIIPQLVRKYVETLPHVRYKAVGINFVAFLAQPEAEHLLIDKFLRAGKWYDDQRRPKTIGITLVYSLDNAELRYRCDAGVRKEERSRDGIAGVAVNGNYHIDLGTAEPLQELEECLGSFQFRNAHFLQFTSDIFAVETD